MTERDGTQANRLGQIQDKSGIRCPKCNSVAEKGSKFCPHCGLRLDVNIDILRIRIEDLKDKAKQCWILSLLGGADFILSLWAILEFTPLRYQLQGTIFHDLIYIFLKGPATIVPLIGILFLLTGIIGAVYYTYKREELVGQLE